MCGIFGIWNIQKQPLQLKVIQDALNAIRHRGPDDEGYLLADTERRVTLPCSGPSSVPQLSLRRIEECYSPQYDLLFGFRRLSILDLSPAGHQPMSNADGSLWIVFNGEIYNYIELRSELQKLGYRFRTQSDTEVILNAYDAWGISCLERFNGMWGFAIYDSRKNRLFCARDRLGIKPFYYYFDREHFVFASEIKALLTDPTIPHRPNDPVIYDYLAYGILDHTEETFYQGIKQLLPAHYLILEKGHLVLQRYWDIDPQNKMDIGAGEKANQEYAQRFLDLFEDAIRIHLRSDVPIGSCLSGGIDSSSIVSMTNRLLISSAISSSVLDGRQKTFSSCFEDLRFDERKYISKIVEATSVESHYVFPSPQNLLEELPKLMRHQDEPFGSTSIYAQWCVMKLAGEHGIRVVLDGQGPDEMLAGYIPFFDAHWGTLGRRGNLGTLINEWSAYRRLQGVSWFHIFQHTLFALSPLSFQRWIRYQRVAHSLNPDFANLYKHRFFDETTASCDGLLSKRLYLFTTKTSLPALLRYEDRNSMAHSIESRVPFLDYRLVEYIFSLPDHQKISNGYTKVVLRNSMKGILPEPIRLRSDKMGFVTPEKVWLSTDLKNWVEEIFHSASFRANPYLDASRVTALLAEHQANKRDLGFMIWRWINLELWLRQFHKS